MGLPSLVPAATLANCQPSQDLGSRHACYAGIRGFEFDTLDDPQGGMYAYSAALKLTGAASTLISPDLLKPGIKV